MAQYVVWRPEGREPFPFEEREITADQWRAVGATDHEGLVWNRANGWKIPRSKVSAEAWPYITGDSAFRVIDEGDPVQDKYESMDYRGLQEAAKERGLPATGTADELRERLVNAANEADYASTPEGPVETSYPEGGTSGPVPTDGGSTTVSEASTGASNTTHGDASSAGGSVGG